MLIQERTDRRSKDQGSAPKVDYHCHISMMEYTDPTNPTVVSVTKEEFITDLDEAGINKAVVLSDKRTSPEQVSAFIKQQPDRFIGFGYVNPLYRGAEEDVIRQRQELDLFGLKLYPTTDGYFVDDPKVFRVYEVAVNINMPVLLHHAGMPEPNDLMKHADPTLIDNIACSFPKLKIVLAHLGYPRVDETLYVVRKHKNVWCDISWPYGNVNHPSYVFLLWRDFLTALNLGVLNKIVFGTDYPGVRQKPYVDMLMPVNRYATHPDLCIPKNILSTILTDNMQPLLPHV